VFSINFAKDFVCEKCRGTVEITKEPVNRLCDGVETETGFTDLGDKLTATGGCETAVTARTRISWVKGKDFR